MEYKKFGADIKYNAEDERFDGVVVGASEDLSFSGESIEELKANFRKIVDEHLNRCAAKGLKPYGFAGKVILRVSGDLHRKLFLAAQRDGKSLNRWIEAALTDCLARKRQK
jgi:predicted HicB family RNase H-like nuclease